MKKTSPSNTQQEREFQKDVLSYLETEVGGYWLKICASSFQKQGEPDIIGCYRGKFYAFELKKDKSSRASELQKYKLKKIKENGGVSMKVFSLNQLKELFENGGE